MKKTQINIKIHLNTRCTRVHLISFTFVHYLFPTSNGLKAKVSTQQVTLKTFFVLAVYLRQKVSKKICAAVTLIDMNVLPKCDAITILEAPSSSPPQYEHSPQINLPSKNQWSSSILTLQLNSSTFLMLISPQIRLQSHHSADKLAPNPTMLISLLIP